MIDAALPPLIQQMMQPEFYSHPVQTPVELVQTHVSYVLLTGEIAYKLKKPVNFGFLDYSTLEKRHHFCQEELRLNQRAAAPVYLEVVPIVKNGDRFQLGQGEAVEYAVKMRQFPQSALLSRQFEQGELTETLLQRLALTVAEFHAQAETSPYIRSFGEVAQVRAAIDENYEQTTGFIGGPQTQAQFDQTQAYSDRFFEQEQTLFQRRIDQDRIRACHGDLHLNNICLWQNQLYLFDCIEFNEPFRFVDVMFDIAYIVMDLDAGDRRDLRTVFLNHYAEQTGDWEGLEILPLYASRQSYVRAKVTSFLLNDAAVSETEKAQASRKAALYYRLAWDYAQPQAGQIFVMSGLSGSGKTTVARQLARQLGAVHLRSDAVRKHLAGIPLSERGSDAIYTPEMSQKTYARLQNLGVSLAKRGYTVILDAKYDRQAARQAVIEQAIARQLPLQILYCETPEAVMQQRLRQRTGDIADATAEILAQQSMEPFDAAEQPHVRLSKLPEI
ncbi:MAG: AAA family ATPase [Leptolyngbyaceae cyanobacterium SL_1_1]|nr:AAA family ATPase [Leptolyngbyaceae cyanobacterium SL_1_1]